VCCEERRKFPSRELIESSFVFSLVVYAPYQKSKAVIHSVERTKPAPDCETAAEGGFFSKFTGVIMMYRWEGNRQPIWYGLTVLQYKVPSLKVLEVDVGFLEVEASSAEDICLRRSVFGSVLYGSRLTSYTYRFGMICFSPFAFVLYICIRTYNSRKTGGYYYN
jgi:hypothetical protein